MRKFPNCSHSLDVFVCMKVILYNFFDESALGNLWKYLIDEDQPKLWDSKYAPLIHEVSDRICFMGIRDLTSWLSKLKCLYVAITRAKHRLWIVDYSHSCESIMVRTLYIASWLAV